MREVELFFVPRHQLRLPSPEMSGMIGGLEVLGYPRVGGTGIFKAVPRPEQA